MTEDPCSTRSAEAALGLAAHIHREGDLKLDLAADDSASCETYLERAWKTPGSSAGAQLSYKGSGGLNSRSVRAALRGGQQGFRAYPIHPGLIGLFDNLPILIPGLREKLRGVIDPVDLALGSNSGQLVNGPPSTAPHIENRGVLLDRDVLQCPVGPFRMMDVECPDHGPAQRARRLPALAQQLAEGAHLPARY